MYLFQLFLKLENSSKSVPCEKSLGIPCEKAPCISKNDYESLYVEALYTIKHKVGRTIDGHSDFSNDLYLYVQDAFKIPAENHARLLARASEEKVKTNTQVSKMPC